MAYKFDRNDFVGWRGSVLENSGMGAKHPENPPFGLRVGKLLRKMR